MRSARSAPTLVIAGAVAIGLLAGCGSTEPDTTEADPQQPAVVDEPVTLSVVSLIPGSEQAAFDAFDERVAQFEDMYPNITIEAVEYEWRATTFAAQLAGGTLPDVYEIPLTDAKTLIENGQLADIDEEFAALPYSGD